MKLHFFAAFLMIPLLATSREPRVSAPYSAANAAAASAWFEAHGEELLAFYRHLHANPELSLKEFKTSVMLARELETAGYEVTSGVGGTGVVAVLKNGEGPVLLVRGDMDALPIVEQTGLPYASKIKLTAHDGAAVGAMHACGHDVHTTMVAGVGRALADLRENWSGTLVLIGQPAEELGRGARMMIADGLFERFPKPDLCLALHVQADKPAGRVGYCSGWSAANVDSVDITIFGKGGHGAKPHTTIDPIVVAASLVTNLQTLVSRRIDPVESAVVTVGSIHAGTKRNIIPSEANLKLTVRSYTDEVRKQLLEGIEQIATDTCRVFQCPKPPKVIHKDEYTPACYNDPELTAASADLFRKLLGDENVYKNPPSMGGEDFGRFARKLGVPGLQYSLGSIHLETWEESRKPGAPSLPSLHSDLYAPDPEPTIRTAILSMANLSMALMSGN